MREKDYRLWSISVVLLEIYCICQMFFAPISRFTIVCAYLTIAILFVMMWFSQRVDQQWRKRMDKWQRDLEQIDREIDSGLKEAIRLQKERLKNDMETHSEATGTEHKVSCCRH